MSNTNLLLIVSIVLSFCAANARWIALPRSLDCVVARSEGTWSSCFFKTYNNGTRHRIRIRQKEILVEARFGGTPCPLPEEDLTYCNSSTEEDDMLFAARAGEVTLPAAVTPTPGGFPTSSTGSKVKVAPTSRGEEYEATSNGGTTERGGYFYNERRYRNGSHNGPSRIHYRALLRRMRQRSRYNHRQSWQSISRLYRTTEDW